MKNRRLKSALICVVVTLSILNGLITLKPSQEEPIYYTSDFSLRTAANPNAFLSIWNSSKTSSGSSDTNQIKLPLRSNGTYNFIVDWGDTNKDNITIWNQTAITHTYAFSGVYSINITGIIIGWSFKNEGDRLKIIEILQWGSLQLANTGGYFFGCSNLNVKATDILNLTKITNFREFFRDCINLGSMGSMYNWDVSSATDMSQMFYGASSFDQYIGSWIVSNVTSMNGMFRDATTFNKPIGSWDVSNVTDMYMMFAGASSFNQPLENWDLSNITQISCMFISAISFNQPIDSWDVSGVTDMRSMFYRAHLFNQYIGSWNVSSVTTMGNMFTYSHSFDQPIGNWDVSNVTDMNYMFYGASSFNQPINNWNVSSVIGMDLMFCCASSFNQPLDRWNVSGVMSMRGMFKEATSFNQPIGNWDVSNVRDMEEMFNRITLSTDNYDNLLLGWSHRHLRHGISFDAGNSKYSLVAVIARENLIALFGWKITDGGFFIEDWSSVILIAIAIASIVVIIFIVFKRNKNRH